MASQNKEDDFFEMKKVLLNEKNWKTNTQSQNGEIYNKLKDAAFLKIKKNQINENDLNSYNERGENILNVIKNSSKQVMLKKEGKFIFALDVESLDANYLVYFIHQAMKLDFSKVLQYTKDRLLLDFVHRPYFVLFLLKNGSNIFYTYESGVCVKDIHLDINGDRVKDFLSEFIHYVGRYSLAQTKEVLSYFPRVSKERVEELKEKINEHWGMGGINLNPGKMDYFNQYFLFCECLNMKDDLLKKEMKKHSQVFL